MDNKSLTTRAVKEAFSSVKVDHRKGEYRNIRRSVSFESISSTPSLEVCRDSQIHRLQQEVALHKQKAKTMMDCIMSSVGQYIPEKPFMYVQQRNGLCVCTFRKY